MIQTENLFDMCVNNNMKLQICRIATRVIFINNTSNLIINK